MNSKVRISDITLLSFRAHRKTFNRGRTCVDLGLLLVFSVTQFKRDQNKNQNRSIDKVQNLGNEGRYICKDSRQNSGHSNVSYARYGEKLFSQIYRDLYGDAMLVPIRMGTNMAARNQQKHLSLSFATKA